jgi:hypothetical protein
MANERMANNGRAYFRHSLIRKSLLGQSYREFFVEVKA